ncbi:MAG: DUF2142 domain-containing protein [Anaerolinea sp.]|nr:DUF2142 domain-containing protein [Anaerolinea sp.]
MRNHLSLGLIVFVYLMLGALFATLTPPWQAPDEPAHYNYVRQLAAGQWPVMELGDYDEAYKNEAVSSGFAPQYDVSVITYEDWQPPLYYLLLTPLFWLTGGSLLALRLASLLLGAGVVALAYGVAWRLFGGKGWLAAGTAVFVAFIPQHLAILASVNNDALAELLIAAILFHLVRADPFARREYVLLGGLLGLGFLTKGTVYAVTAVIAVFLLWQYWGDWRGLIRAGLWVFVPAFLLGGLWWGRNVVVYGGLDVLGKAAHDAVVIGQPRTADLVAQIGLGGALRQLVQTTFHSFWGQFGWMALPMLHPRWLYPLLWLFTAVVITGLLLNQFFFPRATRDARRPTWPLLLLFALTLAVHLGYNVTFIQHQGRYLFPALIPMGVGVMVGLGAWVRPLTSRWPLFYPLLPLGLGLALALLDVWALFRILPNLR